MKANESRFHVKTRGIRARKLIPLLCMFLFVSVATPDPVMPAGFEGITLGLVSISWETQLPVAVAQQAGFFKEQGLEVRSVTLGGGGRLMIPLLSSGDAQMAISGTVAILRGISRGAPIVIVGGYRKSLDWALLGAKELKSVNELKGKKVGVTAAGSMSEFLVIEALKTKGLIRDQDYTILPAGQELLRVLGLKSGNLQAIPLSGGQKVLLESEGYPKLMELRSVFPNLPTSVVLGTKKFVATNSNKVVGVLKALSKAANLIRKDKDRAIQMGKAQRLPGDATVERKALDHYAEDLQVGLRKEDLAAFMKLLGIKEPVEDFFEESLLAGAMASR